MAIERSVLGRDGLDAPHTVPHVFQCIPGKQQPGTLATQQQMAALEQRLATLGPVLLPISSLFIYGRNRLLQASFRGKKVICHTLSIKKEKFSPLLCASHCAVHFIFKFIFI